MGLRNTPQPRFLGILAILQLTPFSMPHHTSTIGATRNSALITLAVLLDTSCFPTVTSLNICSCRRRVSHDTRFECIGVSLKKHLLCLVTFFFMFLEIRREENADNVVMTIYAIAAITVKIRSKAFAVEF